MITPNITIGIPNEGSGRSALLKAPIVIRDYDDDNGGGDDDDDSTPAAVARLAQSKENSLIKRFSNFNVKSPQVIDAHQMI